MSHPVRGAWIEILDRTLLRVGVSCRTPSGVRGLKFVVLVVVKIIGRSHPVRGAWIEINFPAVLE